MFLYLRATGNGTGTRWGVVHVDQSLVTKVEKLAAALAAAQAQGCEVESITAKAARVKWGYLSTDDVLDLGGRRIRIFEKPHDGKAFYSREEAVHDETVFGNLLLTVSAEGVVWHKGPIRTRKPVSVSLLQRIIMPANQYTLHPADKESAT